MSLEDKHIDELFRNAANQSKAPEYQASYWLEMEAMLNASKKQRKGFMAWSSFGVLLMIALVSILITAVPSEVKYSKLSIDVHPEISETDLLYTTPTTIEDIEEVSNSLTPSVIATQSILGKTQQEKIEATSNNQLAAQSVDANQQTLGQLLSIEQLPIQHDENYLNTLKSNDGALGDLIKRQSIPKVAPFSTSIDVGNGVSQAYDAMKSRPTIFNAGLKVNYTINRFSVSSGFGISVEQNPGITVTDRAQVFGFGVTDFEHSLNYKTLVDIAIPLQVAYQSGKNKFGVGAQLRYLGTTSMRFESKENGETIMANNLSGITTGLNPLNADIYGFYERSLTKNVDLGIRVNQQLTGRIIGDKYFNTLNRHKVLSGQVYLKYTLFNH